MGLLENKARARLFYKYLSVVYDRINPFIWTEEMRDEALSMIDLGHDDRVIDVGCGTGFGTVGLLRHTNHIYGLDQSVHQLERAWEKLGKHDPVKFALGDAERLPFVDNAFDVAWSSGSIEYWPNPVEALRELKRVVKPGGTVLIIGPNYPKTTVMQRIVDAIMLFYDETEADRMFRAAGFVEFEHRHMGPSYNPDIAITTLAKVPDTDDSSGPQRKSRQFEK